MRGCKFKPLGCVKSALVGTGWWSSRCSVKLLIKIYCARLICCSVSGKKQSCLLTSSDASCVTSARNWALRFYLTQNLPFPLRIWTHGSLITFLATSNSSAFQDPIFPLLPLGIATADLSSFSWPGFPSQCCFAWPLPAPPLSHPFSVTH